MDKLKHSYVRNGRRYYQQFTEPSKAKAEAAARRQKRGAEEDHSVYAYAFVKKGKNWRGKTVYGVYLAIGRKKRRRR